MIRKIRPGSGSVSLSWLESGGSSESWFISWYSSESWSRFGYQSGTEKDAYWTVFRKGDI